MGKSGVKKKFCAASGCTNFKVPNDGNSIFYFPRDPQHQRAWLKNAGNKELLRHDSSFISRNRFLCPAHFEDKMFWDKFHKSLHRFAIPTIFNCSPLNDLDFSNTPNGTYNNSVSENGSENSGPPDDKNDNNDNDKINRGEKRAHPDDDDEFLALEPVDKVPHMDIPPASTPRRCWLREGARVRSPPPHPQRRISVNKIVTMSGVKNVTKDVLKVARTAQEYRQMALHLTRRLNLTQRKSFTRKKLLSKKSMDTLVEMTLSPGARLILEGELKNLKKKPKGRVWTLDQKVFWLSLYKRSARSYRFLKNYIKLPSETTLKNILKSLVIGTGIIEPCMELLKHSVPAMKLEDRTCAILFDEVFLRGRLKHVLKSDFVDGFENYGTRGKTHLIADHALVFMVQGLNSKWVLPCAFYFVSKTCPRTILALLIKDVITALSNLGLNVVASISDQGPTNRGAISDLKNESGDDVFYCVNSLRIVHIWDIPHIFKNVRNNLLTSDIEYKPGHIARWRDIIDYLMLDNSLCQLSSLTPKHLNPKGRDKMRVCLATEAISAKTANSMEHIHRVTNGLKLPNCMTTVNFIRKADFFFDLTNGPRARSSKEKKKVTRCDVTAESLHHEYWPKMADELRKWTFIRKKDGSRHVPPCITGWIENTKAFRFLWCRIDRLGMKVLKLRHLNQDSLENLFCLIRQCCGSSTDLTCGQFVAALKTCLISRFSSFVKEKNCADDDSMFLSDIKILLQVGACSESGSNFPQSSSLLRGDVPEEITPVVMNNPVHRKGVASHITSSLTKLTSKINCDACCALLTTQEKTFDSSFSSLASMDLYPSTNLVTLFMKIQSLFERKWRSILYHNSVTEKVVLFCKNSLNWAPLFCAEHKTDEVLSQFLSIVAENLIVARIAQCNKILKKGIVRYSRQVSSAKNADGLHEDEEEAELYHTEVQLLESFSLLEGPALPTTPKTPARAMETPTTPRTASMRTPATTPTATPVVHQVSCEPLTPRQEARAKVAAKWLPPPSPRANDQSMSDDQIRELVRMQKLHSLKVDQLKAILKRHHKPVGGKKAELCSRVMDLFN